MSEARVWDRLASRYDTIVCLFDSSYGRLYVRWKNLAESCVDEPKL